MSKKGVRWPFPRIVFAQLIAALNQAGAETDRGRFHLLEESDAMHDQLRGPQ